MSTGEATLVAWPMPFSQRHAAMQVRTGRTIRQILETVADGLDLAETLEVHIGGMPVPQQLWDKVKPKAGTHISVTALPAGGGDSSKWIRAILMVVVIIVAWYAAPFVAGAMGVSATYVGAIAAGLTMLGTMAVNALVPPPRPKLQSPDGGGQSERQFALTGTSNQANPYGVIPLVVGEMRYYPSHAVLPYTEEVGDGKYLRMMLDLGYGDFDVSDIRIGETPIDSFEGVQYEISKFPTLYSDDIFEEAIGAALNDHDVLIRTTQVQADEIGCVIDFQGLFGATSKGQIVSAVVSVTFKYRAVGDVVWIDAPITANRAINWSGTLVRTSKRGPFTVSVSWPVPSGQYEVRIERGVTNWNGADANSRNGDAAWSGLRTIRKTTPSTTGTTKLALRILASDQLNGTVQTLNLLQRQRVPVYNGSTWTAEFSNNPAWVAIWLVSTGILPLNPDIECKAVPIRVTLDKIDLPSFVAFAARCTALELEASMVLDAGVPVMQAFDDVLAAGLASRAMRDGKISVVWDDPDAEPVGMFTPANSISFSGQRNFYELAHALRVKFINPDANYITDEIIVLDDGYSYKGKDARGNPSALPAATRYEVLDLRAARSAQAAWIAGRYWFAQSKFRANTYTLETDIEMLRHTRGDILVVADDVIEWGEGWGRIKAIAGSDITIDDTVTLVGGSGYAARITLSSGEMVVRNATPAAPETSTFTLDLTVPIPAPGLEAGNIVVIGSTSRQTRDLIVTGIMPSQDMNASIKLADLAPEIEPYISDPPDVIVSEATGLSYMDPPDPPHITVIISAQAASTPNDGGTTAPVVDVGIRPGPGYVRSGAGGSNDNPYCVTASSWLDDGLQAAAAEIGAVHVCHLPGTGFEDQPIEAIGPPVWQPCVRLHLVNGGSWSGSRSTPFNSVRALRDLDDLWFLAPDMAGQMVWAKRNGVLRMERVAWVEDIGDQLVVPVSYGGRSFPAGDTADVLVYSHNMRKVYLG